MATPEQQRGPVHARNGFARLLRCHSRKAYCVLVNSIYLIAASALGIALAPALALVHALFGWASRMPVVPAYLVRGFALGLAWFSFGMALLGVVAFYNKVLPTQLHPFKGGFYSPATVTWFLHNALFYLVRYTFLPFITLTPYGVWFLKAMGMKIGRHAFINTEYISDPSFITLGDDVVIGGSVRICAHYGGGGKLVIAPVSIGHRSHAGPGLLHPGRCGHRERCGHPRRKRGHARKPGRRRGDLGRRARQAHLQGRYGGFQTGDKGGTVLPAGIEPACAYPGPLTRNRPGDQGVLVISTTRAGAVDRNQTHGLPARSGARFSTQNRLDPVAGSSHGLGFRHHRFRFRRQCQRAPVDREGLPACWSWRRGAGSRPATSRRSNWSLRRFLWLPRLGFRGLFKMTFLEHVTALSGVGVGGGSLVYANTLPVPKDPFFQAPSWSRLADWKTELAGPYRTVQRMLGSIRNPKLTYPDQVVREVGRELGPGGPLRAHRSRRLFRPARRDRPGPLLRWRGTWPHRLHPLRGLHAGLQPRRQEHPGPELPVPRREARPAHRARHRGDLGAARLAGGGYEVDGPPGNRAVPALNAKRTYTAGQVIFAGGVLGTVPLLLKLREHASGLPALSDRLGDFVRTNSEVLMGVVTQRRDQDLSQGIAIGSILHTDEHSHLEPVRYPAGAGFFRLLMLPQAPGDTLGQRLANAMGLVVRHPIRSLQAYLVPDWAEVHDDPALHAAPWTGTSACAWAGACAPASGGGPSPRPGTGPWPGPGPRRPPTWAGAWPGAWTATPSAWSPRPSWASPPRPTSWAARPWAIRPQTGAIDHRHRLFGYDGLYVVDGSAISANPGREPLAHHRRPGRTGHGLHPGQRAGAGRCAGLPLIGWGSASWWW